MSRQETTPVLLDPWRERVDRGSRAAIAAEVNEYGGALLPQLLTDAETAEFRAMYDRDALFRSTINMSRHRFGEGEYRYFRAPYPEPIERLKQALYPRLLPIARDWWTKLGRPAPWPDTLDEWLDMCHDAGQVKSTAILLKYGKRDWNALHRDLYGELVFPLQVVINLSRPGVDHTGASSCWSSNAPAPNRAAPPRSCRTGTGTSSPPATVPSPHNAAGRPRRSATGSRRSAPASGTRSH
jgi:hypothetical protein